MQRPALNFYVKFTPKNFKGSGSARRARAIFGSASPALQNFISAFEFSPRDLASILKFAPQKWASIFKFSRRRFALNLRAVLHAIFAATRALPAKILSHIISLPQIVAQNFGKNLEINSAETKILRKNYAFKFSAPFAMKNPVPRNFVPLNFMPLNLTLRNSARQNFTPQKSACRNRATKMAALQNFMCLNLAASRNLSPLNSAFKFKASADV